MPPESELGKRTPEEITIVDTSFNEWMGQPRSIIDSVRDTVRDAFHAGYHRGKDVGESEAVESARMGG